METRQDWGIFSLLGCRSSSDRVEEHSATLFSLTSAVAISYWRGEATFTLSWQNTIMTGRWYATASSQTSLILRMRKWRYSDFLGWLAIWCAIRSVSQIFSGVYTVLHMSLCFHIELKQYHRPWSLSLRLAQPCPQNRPLAICPRVLYTAFTQRRRQKPPCWVHEWTQDLGQPLPSASLWTHCQRVPKWLQNVLPFKKMSYFPLQQREPLS